SPWRVLLCPVRLQRYNRVAPLVVILGHLAQLDKLHRIRLKRVPASGPIGVAREQDDLEPAVGNEVEQQLFGAAAAFGVETDQAVIEHDEYRPVGFGQGAGDRDFYGPSPPVP